ncbi:MAG TPA: hypothetical protein VKA48_06380, partial [Gammaproteobacteria bacterium]|nr:hypothetical protein [Gammaproteobacteria bacterium]
MSIRAFVSRRYISGGGDRRAASLLLLSGLLSLAAPGYAAEDPGTASGGGASKPSQGGPLSQREQVEKLRKELKKLESLVPGEASEKPEKAKKKGIQIGGALRLNFARKHYDPGSRSRGGDLGLELFRLSVDGTKGGVKFSAEYRWYPYFNAVHHGWAGVKAGKVGKVQVGIMRVPFGLLPYAAHNYWFGVPYYMGFGDDYDAGAQYLYQQGPLDVRAAFFKNAELG